MSQNPSRAYDTPSVQPNSISSSRSSKSARASIERLSQALAAPAEADAPGGGQSGQELASPPASAGLLPTFSHAAIGSWARKLTLGMLPAEEAPGVRPESQEGHGGQEDHLQSEGEAAIALLRQVAARGERRTSRSGYPQMVSDHAELRKQDTGGSLWSWWGSLSGSMGVSRGLDSASQSNPTQSATPEEQDDDAAIAELLTKMHR